jgi:hypothetical protein
VSTSEQVAVPDPAGPPAPIYPASVEITYPTELNRWPRGAFEYMVGTLRWAYRVA